MKQSLVTGCCPEIERVSRKVRASIFDIQVDRIEEKIMFL